jgi:biopolymer transport protein ExbD
VSVDAASKIFLDEREVEIGVLADEIRSAIAGAPERGVALQVHREVAFQRVVNVLDALKQAGVRDLPAFTEKIEP